jgi:hypothetical protein
MLSHPFVTVREKVLSLAREPEPRLERARCITDLRPVFSIDGGTDEVLGFVAVNTLMLTLDGDYRDQSLAMRVDRDGLVALREVVDRALAKQATLEATLGKAGLADLRNGGGQ